MGQPAGNLISVAIYMGFSETMRGTYYIYKNSLTYWFALDAVCNIYEYIVQPNSLGNFLSNFNNLNSDILTLSANPLIGEVVVVPYMHYTLLYKIYL
jgi:hypothetical protein